MVKKISVLMVIAVVIAICLSGCIGAETILLRDSFEDGWGDWQVDMDLPVDDYTGQPVNASVVINNTFARTGNSSVQMSIDGKLDDGTTWIEQKIEIQEEGEISVEISFFVYSDSESFNVIAHPVAYVGTSQPENESGFSHLGNANVAEGWNQFSYEGQLTVDQNDSLWIALGITVAWETHMEYEIDDIDVRMKS